MQFSVLVFVVYINNLVSIGRTAPSSVNNKRNYRETSHECSGAVSSNVYLSTVSILRALLVCVVNVREEREMSRRMRTMWLFCTIPTSERQIHTYSGSSPTCIVCLCN
jgi:hypothetical protein